MDNVFHMDDLECICQGATPSNYLLDGYKAILYDHPPYPGLQRFTFKCFHDEKEITIMLNNIEETWEMRIWRQLAEYVCFMTYFFVRGFVISITRSFDNASMP